MRSCLALLAAALLSAAASAEDAPARSVTRGDVITYDTWNARYCELLLVKGGLGRITADVYNTLGLNTCDPAVLAAIDTDAAAKATGVRAVAKNGPRFWVVSSLSSHVPKTPVPVATFGGLEMRRVGELALTREMRAHGSTPYQPTTIERDTEYGYPKGRPVFILDDADGTAWVMQAYSQIVDPKLTLSDLAGLGTRLKLPQGWKYRTVTLDRDLTVHPVNGTARILQDDLQNTYDACFDTACSYRP
ncbi:MAG: hypothetical protein U1E40_08700 [Amaricoccus sp.]